MEEGVLVPIIENLDSTTKRQKRYIDKHYPGFIEWLQNKYPFCESLNECLYNYANRPEATSRPHCPVCGKQVNYFSTCGYTKFCSCRCSNSSPETKDKIKHTNLEKYGVENPFQSDVIKDKIKQTNLERYGVEHALQSEAIKNKFKQTNLERYGVENPFQSKEIQNKFKQTNLERYGVEHALQSEAIKNKFKQTSLKRYGVENPMQLDSIKEKSKQTCLNKYGVKHPTQSQEIRNKVKQTNLEKYGVEYPTQSKEIKDKTIQTNLERYGVEYASQSQEFQNKVKQTSLDKYGVEHTFQSEAVKNKIKQTNLERYGVEHASQSDMIKDKIKQTCLKKYNTEYYSQSQEYQSRHDEIQTKTNDTKRRNHTFSSSEIETLFSKYLDSQNIEYKRQYRSKEYPFNCDFYLPKYDLYIEIQASWTHGGHPFNKETDKDILESWKSKNNDFYNNAIETWTVRDVKKREITKLNNLKYLEIFYNDIDNTIKTFENYIKKLKNT